MGDQISPAMDGFNGALATVIDKRHHPVRVASSYVGGSECKKEKNK